MFIKVYLQLDRYTWAFRYWLSVIIIIWFALISFWSFFRHQQRYQLDCAFLFVALLSLVYGVPCLDHLSSTTFLENDSCH